ncbi:glycoside hydrolase family 16 protein [Segetibacter sp.]|jgi:beta-glucanase (GH16 family)|uniref:glycoside hydrolase family 16 protein n=1 Tax=Segetibacter sp. TaxID=2231182 RepID=UPI00260765E2|nr:glycoside hydrolase family 16 protein [Segetibacter sp.]MCW3079871.1 glycoside hydrolase family 16 protein [Segetibacter sp.]
MPVLVRLIFFIFLLTLDVSVVLGQANSLSWKLAWSDEFNYTGLPDTGKWGYEHGFVRNNEKQYYTYKRKENAFVENGLLTITAKKETFRNKDYDATSTAWQKKDSLALYTSAALITQRKASWKFGKIEVRAKIPAGPGVWPAIWMLGNNVSEVGWPLCGEIDIMEFVGHDSSAIHGTMHYADPVTRKHLQSGSKIIIAQPYNDFHIYAAEWNNDEIRCLLDGKVYYTFSLSKAGEGETNAFRKPFYLLLNFALGGSWGRTLNDAVLPQKFIVDYVRVYQQR